MKLLVSDELHWNWNYDTAPLAFFTMTKRQGAAQAFQAYNKSRVLEMLAMARSITLKFQIT